MKTKPCGIWIGAILGILGLLFSLGLLGLYVCQEEDRQYEEVEREFERQNREIQRLKEIERQLKKKPEILF